MDFLFSRPPSLVLVHQFHMKEIQEILKKISELQPDEKAVLATVVDVQGSSYRLPGAKMLILESGETFGIVSGGCLEADVLERAKKVLETNEPQVFTYDTTDDLDSVFSMNMGCRGIVRILLESISNQYLDFLINSFEKKKGVSLVFLAPEDQIGRRVYFSEDSVRGEQIEKDYLETLISGQSRIGKYNDWEFFFERIKPPLDLTVFGAGADAVPLMKIAKNLGWRVNVVDHREKVLTKERFPNADEIIISRPEDLSENIAIGENSVVVLMTHNYEHDKHILRHLLKTDAKYIGALGPKRRTENILQELTEEGLNFSEEDLSKLYAPVGLDIGADTPEGIALSIVAEIQAVLKDRTGGFLRNRTGSIYGRDE